jgi:hypothetical protein
MPLDCFLAAKLLEMFQKLQDSPEYFVYASVILQNKDF